MEQPVILCVEDDERNRAVIKKNLSPKFKLLYFATTSDEALSFINQIHPDVVCAGGSVPSVGETQLLEAINALGPNHIKTVISSDPLTCEKLIHSIGASFIPPYDLLSNEWNYQEYGLLQ